MKTSIKLHSKLLGDHLSYTEYGSEHFSQEDTVLMATILLNMILRLQKIALSKAVKYAATEIEMSTWLLAEEKLVTWT